MQGLAWVVPLLLYRAVVVLAAGNTTCLSSQLDWYTTAVGETPCMTYQRLRQICNSAYVVGDFSATTPGDRCDDQVSDCCCNSVAFVLSMLCMNCQEDAVAGNVAGIDAAAGTYSTYLATCGTSTNYSLPVGIQQAVCNENIKIDNFIYNRTFWSDGSCRWSADYAVEQQAINNNNTFTVCPNQVSPSASLPTSTTAPTTGGSPTTTIIVSALHTSSGNTNSVSSTSTSRTAVIGGAVGGVALTIIAVLGGVYCYRRGKRPRMIQDTPSVFLGQSYGVQPVYGASFTDTEAVATQRYSSLSPVRRHHESGESTLPVIHSLSPERVQSLNPSIGPSYLVNDDFSEVVPYIREDDAGTLIPPHDAPAERLPPAYHSSWVTRNARPSNSDPGEDEVLLDQTVQTTWPSNETRPESTTGVPQEKIASRWSSDS